MASELVLTHCTVTRKEALCKQRKIIYFEFSSLNSRYPIRLCENSFRVFITDLRKCFSLFYDKSSDTETKDYFTFEINKSYLNCIKLTVSGLVADDGDTSLNVFLYNWYKPPGEKDYVCMDAFMKFDAYHDSLTELQELLDGKMSRSECKAWWLK